MFNRNGNISIIFALTIMPIILLFAISIQIMRINSSKQKVSTALDSAVLAAANLKNTHNVQTVFEETFATNIILTGLDPSRVTLESEIIDAPAYRQVSATASLIEEPIAFPELMGEGFEIRAHAQAEQKRKNIEISIILDISSPMSRYGKFANMKSAAKQFIDSVLYDDEQFFTSINLIPFGGNINIGKTFFENYAIDANSNKAIIDPGYNEYYNKVYYNRARNNMFLFSYGDYCIDYLSEDYDFNDIPAQSRSQIPDFWIWNRGHPWCPSSVNTMLLNTNDAQALKTRIDGLTFSNGTSSQIGALWGLKALSPEFRGKLGGVFTDRPMDLDAEDAQKIMILVVGANTAPEYRPRNPEYRHAQSWNRQTIVAVGNTNDRDYTVLGRFNRVCDQARAAGITVYTIGFAVKKGSSTDAILNNCATLPEHYFWVEGPEISDAFMAIAGDINQLAIIR